MLSFLLYCNHVIVPLIQLCIAYFVRLVFAIVNCINVHVQQRLRIAITHFYCINILVVLYCKCILHIANAIIDCKQWFMCLFYRILYYMCVVVVVNSIVALQSRLRIIIQIVIYECSRIVVLHLCLLCILIIILCCNNVSDRPNPFTFPTHSQSYPHHGC